MKQTRKRRLMSKICSVGAMEILDSRSVPTVQVKVKLDNGIEV